MMDLPPNEDRAMSKSAAGGSKVSYRDSVFGSRARVVMDEDGSMEDGDISDDDQIEESNEGTWFGIGMTREEKIEARRPWRNALIIKLVGRSIGYHHHWRHQQTMWRTQGEPLLIDLGYEFFIVKLSRREEYERALSEGPRMIGDNYLHVQRWHPNFNAVTTTIKTLLVWVHFPNLHVDYYKES